MRRLTGFALLAGLVTYIGLARALHRDARLNGSRTSRRTLRRHLRSVRTPA